MFQLACQDDNRASCLATLLVIFLSDALARLTYDYGLYAARRFENHFEECRYDPASEGRLDLDLSANLSDYGKKALEGWIPVPDNLTGIHCSPHRQVYYYAFKEAPIYLAFTVLFHALRCVAWSQPGDLVALALSFNRRKTSTDAVAAGGIADRTSESVPEYTTTGGATTAVKQTGASIKETWKMSTFSFLKSRFDLRSPATSNADPKNDLSARKQSDISLTILDLSLRLWAAVMSPLARGTEVPKSAPHCARRGRWRRRDAGKFPVPPYVGLWGVAQDFLAKFILRRVGCGILVMSVRYGGQVSVDETAWER
ncbi:hypothetical protein B0H66DRAFT_594998 [Apodospora peruviana]|uniref:Uncharacterized protein n=1 Tax=Apodospora peruviana TaxID=516989 RepID=A0AAE0HWJ5_9PEZI|nr:hypothetical protein B0H66DRAFT_594998 [Apodospora peruviana]